MRVRWHGQSAFTLVGDTRRVLIDPFGVIRNRRWDYPPIAPAEVDVLLVTHEHPDHNNAGVALGEPFTVRSQAGTFDSPVGEIVSVASEHDPEAGTLRGANTLIRFELDGLRVCHLGDLGQHALRPEQVAALGPVELLFVPVGGGPTIGADEAHAVVRALSPRWVVPMHYRTPAIDFLEDASAFLAGCEHVERWDGAEGDPTAAPAGAVVPAVPSGEPADRG